MAVDFDGDAAPIVAELVEEFRKGQGSGEGAGFAIDREVNHGS